MLDIDVAVVGAGFAGLYMLHRLRRLGLRARVFEQGSDVGGTWFWNRYPGARCDIESVNYCYSFSAELLADWTWTERYAAQPEILRYLHHVADRFDLRRDIQLRTRVTSARYDEPGNRWLVSTDAGETVAARYCVLAVGNLSSAKRPDIAGLDSFRGEWCHTARWPGGADLRGKRVGIVGTGSTAIQALPQIAGQADQVYVFQRTPNYSMPAQNRPLPPEELREVVRGYRGRRRAAQQSDAGVPVPPPQRSALEVTPAERRRMYEEGWRRGGINALSYAFTDFFTDERANFTAQEFAREKIREHRPRPRGGGGAVPARTTSARSAPAWTSATSRPTTVTTSPWSTCAESPITTLPRAAWPRPRPSTHSTRSSSPSGSTPSPGRCSRSTSAAGTACPWPRSGREGRAPTSGCAWPGSPTCS